MEKILICLLGITTILLICFFLFWLFRRFYCCCNELDEDSSQNDDALEEKSDGSQPAPTPETDLAAWWKMKIDLVTDEQTIVCALMPLSKERIYALKDTILLWMNAWAQDKEHKRECERLYYIGLKQVRIIDSYCQNLLDPTLSRIGLVHSFLYLNSCCLLKKRLVLATAFDAKLKDCPKAQEYKIIYFDILGKFLPWAALNKVEEKWMEDIPAEKRVFRVTLS